MWPDSVDSCRYCRILVGSLCKNPSTSLYILVPSSSAVKKRKEYIRIFSFIRVKKMQHDAGRVRWGVAMGEEAMSIPR